MVHFSNKFFWLVRVFFRDSIYFLVEFGFNLIRWVAIEFLVGVLISSCCRLLTFESYSFLLRITSALLLSALVILIDNFLVPCMKLKLLRSAIV